MSDCVTHAHIQPIPMVCNNIPRDIPERDPPRTYVRTYTLCENRSSIQSLALMRSAIISIKLTPLILYALQFRFFPPQISVQRSCKKLVQPVPKSSQGNFLDRYLTKSLALVDIVTDELTKVHTPCACRVTKQLHILCIYHFLSAPY